MDTDNHDYGEIATMSIPRLFEFLTKEEPKLVENDADAAILKRLQLDGSTFMLLDAKTLGDHGVSVGTQLKLMNVMKMSLMNVIEKAKVQELRKQRHTVRYQMATDNHDYGEISTMSIPRLFEFLTKEEPKLVENDADAVILKGLQLNGSTFMLLDTKALESRGVSFGTQLSLMNVIKKAQVQELRKQRERSVSLSEVVVKEYHEIQERVETIVPENASAGFSNPATNLRIPFVFHGPVPVRFELDGESLFEFYGRTSFQELYSEVLGMNPRTHRRLYYHGTLGSGKSHMIACLVATLKKEGILVCYIPDAHELLLSDPPAAYMLEALLSTFEADNSRLNKLKSLYDGARASEEALESNLRYFCGEAAARGDAIRFVIDQANALDDEYDDRISNDRKTSVRTFLDGISHRHVKVESSTANYRTGKHDIGRNIGERRLTLNQGLDNQEMAYWWGKAQQELGSQWQPSSSDKEFLERLTGRMPILLKVMKQSVLALLRKKKAEETVKGKQTEKAGTDSETKMEGEVGEATDQNDIQLNAFTIWQHMAISQEVGNLQKRIIHFGITQLNALKDDDEEKDKFVQAWVACIFELPVGRGGSEYLDGRYFYVDKEGIGRSTSDFAREVGATVLESATNPNGYTDRAWLNRLTAFADNPSVFGFAVEKIAIATLIRSGTALADRPLNPDGSGFAVQFATELTAIEFHDAIPPLPRSSTKPLAKGRNTRTTVLDQHLIYIPAIFNYPVDCVLVYLPDTIGKINPKKGRNLRSSNVVATSTSSAGEPDRKKLKRTHQQVTSPPSGSTQATSHTTSQPASPQPEPQPVHTTPSVNEPEDLKAIVVGVQFTMSRKHSQTEEPFMLKWQNWENALPWNGEIEYRFLWVFHKIPQGYNFDWEFVPAKTSPTRSGTSLARTLRPGYWRKSVTFKELDSALGNAIDKARMA